MNGNELRPEVIEAVKLANEMGSFSWHLWLIGTMGENRGVQEFLAALKAALDAPPNDEEV